MTTANPIQVSKIIENRVVTIRVGDRIENAVGRIEVLLPSDWDRAEFRFPNPIHEWREAHAIALNIEITGRTFQWRNGRHMVKLRLEWVGDDEPSTYSEGWLLVDSIHAYRRAEEWK